MDRDERRKDEVLSVDRDANINVVVNQPSTEVEIDLRRVLHNFKLRTRAYAWLMIFCIVAGIAGSLVIHQFTEKPYKVSSVVTLNYEVPNPELEEKAEEPATIVFGPETTARPRVDPKAPATVPVADLTAPNGSGNLDLNQITGSYVLNNALNSMELSQPVTLSALRSNISIDRILTEESRRQQEIAASMVQDKNNNAYNQVKDIQLTYDNRFVVSLTNGFGEEDSNKKYYLTDEELRELLDRVLAAYNDYLVVTYADTKLPDDEISVIDIENLDILESLDLLRDATQNLYNYCDKQPDTVKSYRSWRTGRSLNDLMEDLQTATEVNVDYLYSYAYTNSIVRDRQSMITNYQFQLNNAQTKLDKVNENIATTQTILDNYKNDEIFVSMQESDTAKSTQTTTDYYNAKVLQQTDNYEAAEKLEVMITELTGKLECLEANSELADTEQASEELESAVRICQNAYQQINLQMQEIMTSPFYTTYADHSVAQGEDESVFAKAGKKMVIGGVLGALVALALWVISALAPEFRRKPEVEAGVDGAHRVEEAIEA